MMMMDPDAGAPVRSETRKSGFRRAAAMALGHVEVWLAVVVCRLAVWCWVPFTGHCCFYSYW